MDEEADPKQDMVQLHHPFSKSPPRTTQHRHLDIQTRIPKRKRDSQVDSQMPARRRRECYPPTPPGYKPPPGYESPPVYELPSLYALPEQTPPPPTNEPPVQPISPPQANVVIPEPEHSSTAGNDAEYETHA